MAVAASRTDPGRDLVAGALEAADAAEGLLADATLAVRRRVTRDGKIAARLIDREQRATHGLAWLATYAQAVRQLAAYAERMRAAGRFGAIEDVVVRIGLGEYLAQMIGGIAMTQGERSEEHTSELQS